MTEITLHPAEARGRIRAPPSKSFTHRALVAGFLTGRTHRIRNPLVSDDTNATRVGLARLGLKISGTTEVWTLRPVRREGRAPTIDCRESGTTLRFLTAVAALGSRPVRFIGRGRLPDRPIEDLYRALEQLGGSVRREGLSQAVPATVEGPLRSGLVRIRGSVSSQFISALLMVLPSLDGDSTLEIVGPRVSRPYVEATRAVLGHHGVHSRATARGYEVPGNQRFQARGFDVPGDASSAAYLWAAAAVTGGSVEVRGVSTALPQADRRILDLLEEMGADVRRKQDDAAVSGRVSRGVDVDLTEAPDLFPLVGVVAAVVPDGRSQLRGAAHAATKESDRRAGTLDLVRAMGARVAVTRRGIAVRGVERPRALRLTRLADHRMVMSAGVAALAARGPSRIGDANAVRKSFPEFWLALTQLGAGPRSTA